MIPNRNPDYTHENLFQGEGCVFIWNCSPIPTDDIFPVVLWCALSPDGSVGKHRQEGYHEVLTCLSGKGEVTIDTCMHSFEPGISISLHCGQVMSIHNRQEEPLIYLITKTSTG